MQIESVNSGKILWEIKKIKPIVKYVSMVGVGDTDYPISFGNYFEFNSGHYCLNMWAENLRKYCKENKLEDIEILEIIADRLFCLVVDKRIPKEWLNKEYCYTGCIKMDVGLKMLIDFSS